MRTLFLPFCTAALLLATATAEPTNTADLVLKDADKIRVLAVQREQYRAFAEREKAAREAVEAQRRLDLVTGAMTTLRDEFRSSYHCADCELADDLRLTHPAPSKK